MTNEAIECSHLFKTYATRGAKVEVLKDANFILKNSQFMVITGSSGSGKTTLLNVISGIDRPTSGKIVVLGEDLCQKNEDFLADFRCRDIGFVFQSYNLVSTLTVSENIAFPMEWIRTDLQTIENRVAELLELVKLGHRAEHFPSQLSGGEQQRVAFARAMANSPQMLLIDEPTGNLDTKTSLHIIEILEELEGEKKTVVVATHDDRILDLADRKIRLEEGRVVDFNE